MTKTMILFCFILFTLQPSAWSSDTPSMRQLQQVVGDLFGTPPSKNAPTQYLVGLDSSQALCGVRINRGDADPVVPDLRLEAGGIGSKTVSYDQPAIFNDVKVASIPGGFVATTNQPVSGSGDTDQEVLAAVFRGSRSGIDNLDTVSITHRTHSPVLKKSTHEHATCFKLRPLLSLSDAQGEELAARALQAFSATRSPRQRKFTEATYLGDCELINVRGSNIPGLSCTFDLSPASGDGDEPSIEVQFAITQGQTGQAQVGNILSTKFFPN